MVLNAYQELLNKAYSLVDEGQIGKITGYLNKADRVLVCGLGSSGLSAREMEIRFMNSSEVYAYIYHTVKDALESINMIPEVELSSDKKQKNNKNEQVRKKAVMCLYNFY